MKIKQMMKKMRCKKTIKKTIKNDKKRATKIKKAMDIKSDENKKQRK